MKPHLTLCLPLLAVLPLSHADAGTGTAITGDVTVDTRSSAPVAIPDAALLAALRTALAKPTGDITEADLLTLTALRLDGLGIADLSGLEFATNLRILDIRRNAFADAAALWAVLDQITPMYCLYVDIRRPGNDPAGLLVETLTDSSGNSFFILVDPPNLPVLDFNSLDIDTTVPANISALQTISDSGVQVDTGGVNLPPYASANATVLDAATAEVELSAGGSSDIDGTITGYAWSWADGSASGSDVTVTLPFGDTPVTLTVTDDDGATSNATVTVTIEAPYTAPVVSNLTASQREGTKLVDISYDVTAVTPTVTTSLRISSDSGATFEVPAVTLTGDIGADVTIGTGKTITWDAGSDWDEQFSETMRFEVTADDGEGGEPDDMVTVQGGTLTTSNDLNGTVVSTFQIGKTEVTWGEWKAVRAEAVARGYDIGSVGAGCADDHPVHSVNWYDVVKWCNLKSEIEGLTPVYTTSGAIYKIGQLISTQNLSASGYRLPTEAEWEFAARGGNQTNGYAYSGGNTIDDVAWYSSNASGSACNLFNGRGTWPVGAKAPNELGLHDMSGNVWEWCWDASRPYQPTRGGSWYHSASYCAVSYLGLINPDSRHNAYGFRLARSSEN